MIFLPKTVAAYNSKIFEDVFKKEVETLSLNELPLQQALSQSSYVSDSNQWWIFNKR